MDRRKFMKHGILGVSALSTLPTSEVMAGDRRLSQPGELTATQVLEHLRNMGADWIDAKKSVDTFKAGDPDMIVKGIAVGWMSYWDSLKKAEELGCNLFVTHEPTYYDHYDRDPSVFAFDAAQQKKDYVQESGIGIIRCHDVWDRVPEIGIRDAWAGFLGFSEEIDRRIESDRRSGQPYCGAYEIKPKTAEQLARDVASKVAGFGQDHVQLIGPPDKIVSSVAIGTGAITPFRQMVRELKTDLVICSDDGFSYWRDGALAIDMQYPVIVVNHACTEEVGMRRLAGHLADQFSPVPVHHISQSCMFRTIGKAPDEV